MAATRDLLAQRRRTLRVSLNERDWGALHELSAAAGLSPEQLATVWVTQAVSREDATRALRSPVADTRLTESRAASSDRGAVPEIRGFEAASGPGPGQSPLHHEILAVMSENGGAMTVSEIAAAIRRRGRYLAPRRSLPVTPELVSRRVSNPHYRSLFQREGRMLRLADPIKKPKS